MRKKQQQSFAELVKANKVEIMKDEKMMAEIEKRWENRKIVDHPS